MKINRYLAGPGVSPSRRQVNHRLKAFVWVSHYCLLFTSLLEILAYVNPLENLNYSGELVELSTMPTNWTLSTIEAALFVAFVVILAGAGTWAGVG